MEKIPLQDKGFKKNERIRETNLGESQKVERLFTSLHDDERLKRTFYVRKKMLLVW